MSTSSTPDPAGLDGLRVAVDPAGRRVRLRLADDRDVIGVAVDLSPADANVVAEMLAGAAVAAGYPGATGGGSEHQW